MGGRVTTQSYDGAGRLTGVTVPTGGAPIRTSYGYDVAGNLARVTDGRGEDWWYRYTPWGQLEESIEPATEAHPDRADRSYVAVYDAGGLPIEERQPGDVVLRRTFDALAQALIEEAEGPGLVAATRTFTYDLAGRRTSFSHPEGAQVTTYDDRGLPVSSEGPAGDASWSYDAAGRMIERVDASGDATFSWNARGQLEQMIDPLTGVAVQHDYDPTTGRLDAMRYGDGAVRGRRTTRSAV